MRCRGRKKNGLGLCGNYLGDARFMTIGDVIVCRGCFQKNKVRKKDVDHDNRKAAMRFRQSVKMASAFKSNALI